MSGADDRQDLRGRVAGQLELLYASGGPLAVGGPRASVARLTDFWSGSRPRPHRDQLWRQITERYLARQTDVERDGRAALLTAGSPGAGKSTTLDRLGLAGSGWRRLDADVIKSYLLEHDVEAGYYDDLLARQLADGHPILPAELAPLVHLESVALLDQIRDLCLRRAENVLLEGTLTWEPAAAALLQLLVSREYRDVTILDVEVTRQTAQEQALRRWWTGRQTSIAAGTGLGGRFLPAAVIDRAYSPTAANAQPVGEPHTRRSAAFSNAAGIANRLFGSDTAQGLPALRLTVVDNTGHFAIVETHERVAGQPAHRLDGQGTLPGVGGSVTPLHPRAPRGHEPRGRGR